MLRQARQQKQGYIMLRAGDTMPDFRLPRLSGDRFHLYTRLQSGPIMLVLLRHPGCLPVDDHVQALIRAKADFDRQHTTVVMVSFVNQTITETWRTEMQLPFPIVMDSERTLYQQFGLNQSILRVWQPAVLWYYIRAILAGRSLKPGRGDPHQLGGTVIINATHRIILAHRSRNPMDYPEVSSLLEIIRAKA